MKTNRSLAHNVRGFVMLPKKHTLTLNLRQIMKAQNNVTVQDQEGNSSKPLLYSRLFKFRVFDSISKEMHTWEKIKKFSLTDFELEHYTLMQLTGLKSKCNNEIYEGDIVKSIRFTFVVKWIGAGFKLISKDGKTWSTPNIMSCIKIGNIFENPELL